MGKGPLSGIKILDLTQFEAGTVCTESLAWMGAEVIKVERPKTGELSRYSAAKPGVEQYCFVILNMNKKSVTCNMKSPEGKEIIHGLLKKCDVIVENMGPGAMERLGLSYEECKAVNDKIIYASIKGFSKQSPYAEYPAFDPIATHTGGFVAMTGTPEFPVKSGINVADSGAGISCAMSICAALYQREKQGVGQRIDVAMQDFIIGLGRAVWENYYNSGRKAPERVANEMPQEHVAPSDTYRCKPGGPNDFVHIYVSRAPGSTQFASLCKVIGHEEFIDDPRMQTPQDRYLVKDILNKAIEEWTMQHEKHEAMDILATNDIPAGALLDIEDFANEKHYMDEGIIIEVDHYQHGKLKMPGFAPRMSENHIEYESSPKLGEHTDEIYKELLGMSDDKLKELRDKNII